MLSNQGELNHGWAKKKENFEGYSTLTSLQNQGQSTDSTMTQMKRTLVMDHGNYSRWQNRWRLIG